MEDKRAGRGVFQKRPSFVLRSSKPGEREEKILRDAGKILLSPPAKEKFAPDPSFKLDAFRRREIWGNLNPLVIEIGSGQGEQVEWAASRFKNLNFLALEVFPQGMAHTVRRLKARGIENARILQADAFRFFSSNLIPNSVFEVWSFFPDPWPKMKHHRRRLISEDFAPRVASALVPGGHWRIATDDSDYALQIHEVLDAFPGLENIGSVAVELPLTHFGKGNRDLQASAPKGKFFQAERFEDRTLTSFEKKGMEAGRQIYDFDYEKI
ncbi:MAG: tRNA (guanine-N7)-methyltransferase [Aeriscardovia sp.]|nr:tRNA (guanine-N7)-methyltransferase [Aeriscardovia sp.]